ncbi:hypothetical protein LZC95_29715 [Pendulispora brunnea]|uniref:Uncharacterized protein n=1 Tax=Pendulispora brunnea TaxID=2905690 RepID=A0ABZ2JVX1_9BACT
MNVKSSCFSFTVCFSLVALAGCAANSETETLGMEASGVSVSSDRVSSDFPHCVVAAVPVRPGEEVSPSIAPPAAKCFHTYAEATSFATKGRVNLPKNATMKEVDDAVADDTTRNLGIQSIVIAREYANANYSLPSLAVTADAGCQNQDWVFASMPSGWNDVISSALIYGGVGCFHGWHYETNNFGGANLDVGAGVGDFTYMNDRTSSIRWTR